jgi:hypothetical protein
MDELNATGLGWTRPKSWIAERPTRAGDVIRPMLLRPGIGG